jgi:hypothetical protein
LNEAGGELLTYVFCVTERPKVFLTNVGAARIAMRDYHTNGVLLLSRPQLRVVGAYGPTAGTSDRSLRNDIALQILRGGGNLNEIKQKVDYLCKAGFIDAEKSSWRRRWLDASNPCDNPGGK